MKSEDYRKYAAESIGTAALVLIGCGSAVIAGKTGVIADVQGVGLLGISFAFGLAVLVMVYAVGGISGCHINPAITVAMFVAGKITGKDAIAYIIAQCIGAIIGAGILLAIAEGSPAYTLTEDGLGQNGYGRSLTGYDMWACFLAEVVLTALFLFVIFGSTSEKAPKGFAGIAIGFTLVLIHLVSIPITGTSVNPARSLGPAVFVRGDALSQLWLFWVAPLLGGILAAVMWKFIFAQKPKELPAIEGK